MTPLLFPKALPLAKAKVPALTLMLPVWVLAPDSVSAPAPSLVNRFAPDITPDTTTAALLLTVAF